MAAAARRNGTVIPAARGSQTPAIDSATTVSYDGRLSATVIVTLEAGDIIDLAITVVNTLPAGLDAVINAALSLIKLG